MIKKMRIKFIAVCMILISVILLIVLAAVYTSMRHGIQELSRQVLYEVLEADTGNPANRPEAGISFDGNRVLLPYFTVNIWGNTAYITGGTYSDLEDTDALKNILSQCLSRDEPEGVLKDYHMRYLRRDNGLYQKLSFVDTSMEEALLQRTMVPFILIALAALLIIFVVTVFLSRLVTRPVEKAWQQQQQFLSDASHELKTPLTVILSNASLLESAELPEKPARWVDNIHSEGQQMKTLVEEMLTLARADQLSRAPIHGPVSLSDIAVDCALAFEPVAFEAGKPLEYAAAPGVAVLGDGEKLRQLLSILLDNAIKYGAEGGAVTLKLEKTDRQARILVENPGPPIPAEKLAHLFERFYRADDSRGERNGFGLGLAIARTIAEEHRGAIRAESDAVSTRFFVTLPLKK